MVRAQNAFALDLYRQVGHLQGAGNLFLSPYSAFAALAMAAEGARFETADEMGRALHLDAALRRPGAGAAERPWDFTPIHEWLGALARAMAEGEGVASPAMRERIESQRAALAAASESARRLLSSRDRPGFRQALDEVEATETALDELLTQVDRYELRTANALWGEASHPFDPAYVRTIETHYGTGGLESVDFLGHAEEARQRINAWAAAQTEQRIRDLLPPGSVGPFTRLVLANAIYFKGGWAEVFDEVRTDEESFWLAGGGTAQVPLMCALLEHPRYGAFRVDGSAFATPRQVPSTTRNDADNPKLYPGRTGLQVLELPYKGGDIAMVVLLPGAPDGLPELEARLTPQDLEGWLGHLESRAVWTLLPRFEIEQGGRLASALCAMGMKRAFEQQHARFDGMTLGSDPEQALFISEVIQKAFVEVNERGTEAAAATAILAEAACAMRSPETVPFVPTFRADRPFLFLIRDVRSSCILFMGRFARP